jgi:hypothetical protein
VSGVRLESELTSESVKLRAREDDERDRVALQDKVCRLMAQGLSLTKICKIPGMPHINTVIVWRRKYSDFAAQYHMARLDRGDTLRDRAIDVAEKSTPWTVHADRLKVDTYKWAASKDNPRQYSDRVELGLPVQPSTPASEMSKVEAARHVAFCVARTAHLAQQQRQHRAPLLLEGHAETVKEQA